MGRQGIASLRSGQVIERLTLLRREIVRNKGKSRAYWVCLCKCGTEKRIAEDSLRHRKTRSCGCLKNETTSKRFITHGMSKSGEYRIYHGMLNRCYDETNSSFRLYGGRGITVCQTWRNSFSAFLSDMGNRPSRKHTLERIDNDKGYSPDNCVWATRSKQANNKRTNHTLTWNGETATVMEWHRRTGLHWQTILRRIHSGWPPELVLTAAPGSVRKTHCPHGHEYTPENTLVQWRNGYPCRSCRECMRKANREYHKLHRQQVNERRRRNAARKQN